MIPESSSVDIAQAGKLVQLRGNVLVAQRAPRARAPRSATR